MPCNNGYVRVRRDRVCSHCGGKIEKGSESYTTNYKGEGRKWYCLDCNRVYLDVKELEWSLGSYNEDEEEYFALMDRFDEGIDRFNALKDSRRELE